MKPTDELKAYACPSCLQIMQVAGDNIVPGEFGPVRCVNFECMTCEDVIDVTVEFGLDTIEQRGPAHHIQQDKIELDNRGMNETWLRARLPNGEEVVFEVDPTDLFKNALENRIDSNHPAYDECDEKVDAIVMRALTYDLNTDGTSKTKNPDGSNPRCKHGTDVFLYDCMECEKEQAEKEQG